MSQGSNNLDEINIKKIRRRLNYLRIRHAWGMTWRGIWRGVYSLATYEGVKFLLSWFDINLPSILSMYGILGLLLLWLFHSLQWEWHKISDDFTAYWSIFVVIPFSVIGIIGFLIQHIL